MDIILRAGGNAMRWSRRIRGESKDKGEEEEERSYLGVASHIEGGAEGAVDGLEPARQGDECSSWFWCVLAQGGGWSWTIVLEVGTIKNKGWRAARAGEHEDQVEMVDKI